MINARIYSVCKNTENDVKEYTLLLCIEAKDGNYKSKLDDIDKTLNLLFGDDSDYKKKTQRSIVKVNSYYAGNDYYLPCDISVLITVLELFTYKENTNAFLSGTLITKEQVSGVNRREFYFFLLEYIKKGILDLKKQEKEEKPVTLEQVVRSFFC